MALQRLQKPLGWLQRFLFNVENGEYPYPQPVLSIETDWPLDPRPVEETLASVVGNVTHALASFPGDDDHHWLITHLTITAPSGLSLGKNITVQTQGPDQVVVPIWSAVGSAAAANTNNLPIIGCGAFVPGSGGYSGMAPVYLAPGTIVTVLITNNAVENHAVRGRFLRLAPHYPLKSHV